MAFLKPCSMPAGAVHQNVAELLLQLGAQLPELRGVNGVLVPCLGGGNQIELALMLVPDHGLVELAITLDYVDQVVNYAVLQPHDHVQVAQPNVGVDHNHFVPAH